MDSLYSRLFFFGALSILLTVLGGAIPLLRRWQEDHLHNFVSFSAGVFMATAFLHLLPEAIAMVPPVQIGAYILGSFLALFILEKFIMLHPCEESHCDYHTIGLAAFFGMLIHTFFDGVALGASLMVGNLGSVVFFAIMAHKVPSSFSLASILKKAKWSTRKILVFIFIFGAIIPLGALASLTVLKTVGDQAVGIGLALSLGTFIYIATSDFLPEVHRVHSNKFKNLASFLLGILLIAGMKFLLPHVH
jgi:zinc and cadmium transporter